MAWIRIKGIEGLVYQPEAQPAAERKHNCKDCFCCRHCSDICCSECLKGKAKRGAATSTTRSTNPKRRKHRR